MVTLVLVVVTVLAIVGVTAYALVSYVRSLVDLASSACELDRATREHGSRVKQP